MTGDRVCNAKQGEIFGTIVAEQIEPKDIPYNYQTSKALLDVFTQTAHLYMFLHRLGTLRCFYTDWFK